MENRLHGVGVRGGVGWRNKGGRRQVGYRTQYGGSLRQNVQYLDCAGGYVNLHIW